MPFCFLCLDWNWSPGNSVIVPYKPSEGEERSQKSKGKKRQRRTSLYTSLWKVMRNGRPKKQTKKDLNFHGRLCCHPACSEKLLGNRCLLTLNLIFMKIKNRCRGGMSREPLSTPLVDGSPGTSSSNTVFGREELFLAAEGLRRFE